MKLEFGKSYRTIDGAVLRCEGVTGDLAAYLIHPNGNLLVYNIDGTMPGGESTNDIIAEVEDET